MKNIKPKKCASHEKLSCDWTNKKKNLINYSMLKSYVRHGMVVGKIHEISSIKQSRWLEKYISFSTQKRNRTKNSFQKDFYKLLVNTGFKMLEVRNRIRLETFKKEVNKNITEQQSKLTFNGIHKSYEKRGRSTFKHIEVLMDKPISVGFAILDLSKLHIYEKYYEKLQPSFGEENIRLPYMEIDSFVLSVNTKDIIKDFKKLEDIFDFRFQQLW